MIYYFSIPRSHNIPDICNIYYFSKYHTSCIRNYIIIFRLLYSVLFPVYVFLLFFIQHHLIEMIHTINDLYTCIADFIYIISNVLDLIAISTNNPIPPLLRQYTSNVYNAKLNSPENSLSRGIKSIYNKIVPIYIVSLSITLLYKHIFCYPKQCILLKYKIHILAYLCQISTSRLWNNITITIDALEYPLYCAYKYIAQLRYDYYYLVVVFVYYWYMYTYESYKCVNEELICTRDTCVAHDTVHVAKTLARQIYLIIILLDNSDRKCITMILRYIFMNINLKLSNNVHVFYLRTHIFHLSSHSKFNNIIKNVLHFCILHLILHVLSMILLNRFPHDHESTCIPIILKMFMFNLNSTMLVSSVSHYYYYYSASTCNFILSPCIQIIACSMYATYKVQVHSHYWSKGNSQGGGDSVYSLHRWVYFNYTDYG